MSFSSDQILNIISIICCVLIILLSIVVIVFDVMFLINDTVRSETLGNSRISITKSYIGGMIVRLLLVFVLFALALSLLILEIKVIKEEDPYQKKKLQEEAKKMRIACSSYFGVLVVVGFMYLYFVKDEEEISNQSDQSLMRGTTNEGKVTADESEKEAVDSNIQVYPHVSQNIKLKTKSDEEKEIMVYSSGKNTTKLGISEKGDLWLVRFNNENKYIGAKKVFDKNKIPSEIENLVVAYDHTKQSDYILIMLSDYKSMYSEYFPRDNKRQNDTTYQIEQ